MLRIRPFLDSDYEAIKTLHAAQGLPYALPEWSKPEFLVRTVIENGNGPEMFLALRKTAETFLIFDPKQASRRETIGRILAITKESTAAAKRAGLTDVFCVVPPEVEKFGHLLERLGWTREIWPCFFRKVDL